MIAALEALGAAIRQVSSHFLVSVVTSLVATLLSLPIVLLIALLAFVLHAASIIPLGAALLVAVLPNPAAAGLQTVARDLAQGEVVVLRAQREGLREYWGRALVMWLISLAVSAFLIFNILFYAGLARSSASLEPIGAPLETAWVLVFLFWLSVHLYLFPLLIEQKVKRVPLIYRNAALMAIGRPVFGLVVTLVWIAVVFAASLTGLATLFGLALGAVIQQNAFARILPTFELS